MRPNARRELLLTLLRERRFHSVQDLKRKTGIPHATLHRDLNVLSRDRKIRKTYGEVEILDDGARLRDYDRRIGQNADCKLAIAAAALRYVRPGDHLFLDASSTCYYFGLALFSSGLEGVTVVTNSIHLLNEYQRRASGIALVSTGGSLHRELYAFLGDSAMETMQRLRLAKAFVSAGGFSLEGGLSTTSEAVLGASKAALGMAQQRYALLDSSKFGRDYVFTVSRLNGFDAIITDAGLPADAAHAIEALGPAVTRVAAGEPAGIRRRERPAADRKERT